MNGDDDSPVLCAMATEELGDLFIHYLITKHDPLGMERFHASPPVWDRQNEADDQTNDKSYDEAPHVISISGTALDAVQSSQESWPFCRENHMGQNHNQKRA